MSSKKRISVSRAALIAQYVALNAAVTQLSYAGTERPDDGQFIHDRIVQANAALFTESYFSEPLTTYAVGWKDPNDIEKTLEFYAPKVIVPRRFEYGEGTNAEEFYSEDNDLRAIRADFPEVEYTEKKTNAKTLNRGLAITIDLDQVADKDGWREYYTAKLLRRLKRNSLRRAIALLSAGATNTGKTWDSTAGKDPDNDVLSELVTATTTSGVRPTRIGYGETAFSKRILSHRAQDNAGGYASAGLTPEQLGAFLAADVNVSRERYNPGTGNAEVIGNLVLMFNALAGADTEDPSNIKRFVSPCDGGGDTKVYEHQISPKLIRLVVEHYEYTTLTSLLGIRKFTVS